MAAMLIHPGTATRMCYENETWGAPDVLSCQSLEIVRVSQEVYKYTGSAQDLESIRDLSNTLCT